MEILPADVTDEATNAALSTCLPHQIYDDLPDEAIESETEDSTEVSSYMVKFSNFTDEKYYV
jgi:hypothetical protein